MSSLSVQANTWALNAFAASNALSTSGLSSLTGTPTSTSGANSDSSTSGSASSGSGSASSTQFSSRAKLYSELQQLQQQNPTEYTSVVTQIANQLNTDAQGATGKQQQVLQNLASKFTSAESGNLSALQPPTTPNSTNPAVAAYSQYGQPTTGSATGSTSQLGANSTSAEIQQALSLISNALNGTGSTAASSANTPAQSPTAAPSTGPGALQQAWMYILNTVGSAVGSGAA
jgi:hypothetical protein